MQSEIFGPVFSRRLGYSLGINHLPDKRCTYSCVYCQIGRTTHLTISREAFSHPEEIVRMVEERLTTLERESLCPDTITLVPNGEPTLDKNIERILDGLGSFGIPRAVISNASLLWMDEVRKEISSADVVSVKIDSLNQKDWKRINRPHGRLEFNQVIEGIREFSKTFRGEIITETMLIGGVNDKPEDAERLAAFLTEISPGRVFIASPLRPPAEVEFSISDEVTAVDFLRILKAAGLDATYLDNLPKAKNADEKVSLDDLVDIIKVHPLQQDELLKILSENHIPLSKFDEKIEDGIIILKDSAGQTFYLYNHLRK